MNQPYIAKYIDIGPINVWRVNGKYIRECIDSEFVNFGQHYRYSYIPEAEFWLDIEDSPGEAPYFLKHLLTEYRLMKKGASYDKALLVADRAERRERDASKLCEEVKKLPMDDQLAQVRKEHLKEYSRGVQVWIVRGELVRDLFYVDFTEGGHDLVYPFIPAKEVWIDDDLEGDEKDFVLLHELHERNLMHMGWCYDHNQRTACKQGTSAHEEASIAEYYCRMHPDEIKSKLEHELNDGLMQSKAQKFS